MPRYRIVLRDGQEEEIRWYERLEGKVILCRGEDDRTEIDEAEIDLEATFLRNADVDFDPPGGDLTPGEPLLELLTKREHEAGDYLIVEGLIRNVARIQLVSVVAKVLIADEDGKFVTGDEALVDVSPLRAGAESPFRVVIKTASRPARTRILFRALLGEELPTRGLES